MIINDYKNTVILINNIEQIMIKMRCNYMIINEEGMG